jgi:hypothetical protein
MVPRIHSWTEHLRAPGFRGGKSSVLSLTNYVLRMLAPTNNELVYAEQVTALLRLYKMIMPSLTIFCPA